MKHSTCLATARKAIRELSMLPVQEADPELTEFPALALRAVNKLCSISSSGVSNSAVASLLPPSPPWWSSAPPTLPWWSSASPSPPWWSSALPTLPWWSSAPPSPPWWSSAPPTLPWWSSAPPSQPWWSSAPPAWPWWSSAPPSPPWWSSALPAWPWWFLLHPLHLGGPQLRPLCPGGLLLHPLRLGGPQLRPLCPGCSALVCPKPLLRGGFCHESGPCCSSRSPSEGSITILPIASRTPFPELIMPDFFHLNLINPVCSLFIAWFIQSFIVKS